MPLAKIAAEMPLTVLMPGATTPQPAKVVGTYVPVVNTSVVVIIEPQMTYILGTA